jgi:hypothetical protein
MLQPTQALLRCLEQLVTREAANNPDDDDPRRTTTQEGANARERESVRLGSKRVARLALPLLSVGFRRVPGRDCLGRQVDDVSMSGAVALPRAE